MSKVALIRLEKRTGRYDSADENLGLGYLTSVLRQKKIDTILLDSSAHSVEEMAEKLISFSPDVLGYNIDFLNMEHVLEFNNSLNFEKKPFLCFGGPHATFSATDLLNLKITDAVIMGEGEETLPELVLALEQNESLSEIKGLAYKENGVRVFNETRDAISDLDVLPFPARDILEERIKKHREKAARIVTSRGCLYDCKFCITPPMRKINPGKKYRTRNAKNVVDELEEINNKYGISLFYFNDDLYFGKPKESKQRALDIADEILKRDLKIKYKVELRVDSVDIDQDKDMMLTLRKSGLFNVFLGIESGSNKMLDYLGKRTTDLENKKCVEFLNSCGITTNTGKILFGPFTKWDELRDSFDSFYEMGLCAQILRRPNTKLEAFPGTELTKKIEESGLLEDKPSYLYRGYEFENKKIKNFSSALENSFDICFPKIKQYFDTRRSHGSPKDLDSELNQISYNFLIKNTNLGDNWTKEKFNSFLEELIQDIEDAMK